MSVFEERKKKLDKIRGYDFNELAMLESGKSIPLDYLINLNIPEDLELSVAVAEK